jgi:hypothetical protein
MSMPEMKYCFIKLVQQFALEEPITYIEDDELDEEETYRGVKKLAIDLGVSDVVLKKTLSYLMTAGYITQETIATISGRPPSYYHWQMVKMLSIFDAFNFPSPDVKHRSLIEHLLKPDFGTKGGANKARHPLKLSNRLVLMILLSHADEYGVVRDLGMSEFCRLACMSRDRLESQLNKLKIEGYVRSSVSGLTGVSLFGLVKSVFYINLRHVNYEDCAYSGFTFLFKVGNLFDEFEFKEASQVFREANKWQGSTPIVDKATSIVIRRNSKLRSNVVDFENYSLPIIADFFKENKLGSERVYLQVKLEEYASNLLTHRWSDINTGAEFIDEVIMDRIRNEILHPKMLKNTVDGLFPSDDQRERFFEFIYVLSYRIAESIKSMLASDVRVKGRNMSFCILPNPNFNNAYAVEVFDKPQRPGKTFCIEPRQVGMIMVMSPKLKIESEMDVEERYSSGLLTKIESKEVKWPQRTKSSK